MQGDPVFVSEDITPAKAEKYLQKNLCENRRASPQSVCAYAADMQQGKWALSHEAIAFDVDGNLIDGQQRLKAVIESGCTVRMIVARRVSKDAFPAINAGKPRNGSDMARWMGLADRFALRAAIAGRLIRRTERKRVLNTQYPDAFERYSDGMEFVLERFPKSIRKITSGAVLAALVRAYYSPGVSKKKLSQFCAVLESAQYEENERAAHVLREWLLNRNAGGEATLASIYLATGYCLNEFIKGNNTLKRIHVPKQDVFTPPWELAA